MGTPKTSTPKTDVKVPTTKPVLRQVSVNTNTLFVAPCTDALKPFSPLFDIELKHENIFGLAPNVRSCVGSTARRMVPGWSKRSAGNTPTDQEDIVGNDSMMCTISFDLFPLLLFRTWRHPSSLDPIELDQRTA